MSRHSPLLAFAGISTVLLLLAPSNPAVAMSVEVYLDTAKRQEAAPSLSRYFVGMRDGLFEFNDALSSAGIKVFCPPAAKVIMEAEELRRRVDTALRESQSTQANFAEYAGSTTVGLVALEILNALYPCEVDEEGAPEPTGR